MITQDEYFSDGHGGLKEHRPEHVDAATDLLSKVEALEVDYLASNEGATRDICPNTGSEISGSHAGNGDGGFRLSTTTITATPNSKHRIAHAVDKYDPANERDAWLDTFEDGKGGNSKLEEYGLYREHPSKTEKWCHLQDMPPGSGRRTFYP